MSKLNFLWMGLVVTLLFSACTKDDLPDPLTDSLSGQNNGYSASSSFALTVDTDPCGDPIYVDLLAGQFTDAGDITVFNDEEYLYVSYTTTDDWVLGHTHLYVGPCDEIPTNPSGAPKIGHFPNSDEHDPYVTEYTYVFLLDELDECNCLAAHAEVHLLDEDGSVTQSETGWGEGSEFPGNNSWAMFFEYCEQPCLIEDEEGDSIPCDEQLRTQTQGGWGAVPHGQNPGVFLHEKFGEAFPNGLLIGCGNTVTFTSAQAITDYLPAGGPSDVLTQSYVDPDHTLENVLVSQLTAISLSLGFDAYYPTFGASDLALADMYIATGTFEAWTVAEVVGLAHQVLGGCNTDYTFSEITEVLDQINNNYVDGNTNEGFLNCGPDYQDEELINAASIISVP